MADGHISWNTPAWNVCVINYILPRTIHCPSVKSKCAMANKKMIPRKGEM